jgi:ribonuclease T2
MTLLASLLSVAGVQAFSIPSILAAVPKSCSSTELSCHNTTVQTNLCCFNAPGGQLLQTQFWDTDPATGISQPRLTSPSHKRILMFPGPVDSWTVHGLWPDLCDGTYEASCDSSREYTGIGDILKSFGKTDLLNYMNTYWKDYQGNDETFWEHEWGKHGTCVSTLEPSCYDGYTLHAEMVDFFDKTVELFKGLDSYKVSRNKTYSTTANNIMADSCQRRHRSIQL